MPINWQELLQLAPLAMAKPGSPQAAAVLQGYQQSMQRLQQERERREGVASQQAQQAWQRDVQERQLSMQDQQHKAQLANTQADNTRADQAELRQKHQDALARLSQGIGAFTPAINQIAETATDPVQAENALMQRSSAIGSAYGLDPSALSGFIPPMAPIVSARKKKRAETMYADAEKRFNVKDKDGNPVNPEWDNSVTLQTGDLFGDVTPAQLLEMFSAPAVDATGQPARAPRRPSKSATPGSFEEFVDADPARQKLIEGARKRYNQSDDRPVQAPVTRYQSKEVVNDQGQSVLANYDAVTGIHTDPESGQPIKRPRPVPSAMEAQDSKKFAKAKPVLSALSELSERINTMQGVYAAARGEVEKAKAKVNLSDDVAEYQGLVSGFTPLLARAWGHTGVLTQMDVDSVKEMLPQPGNSKSLRDRKIGRVLKIMGQLEGMDPGAAPAAAPAAAPTSGNPFRPGR